VLAEFSDLSIVSKGHPSLYRRLSVTVSRDRNPFRYPRTQFSRNRICSVALVRRSAETAEIQLFKSGGATA